MKRRQELQDSPIGFLKLFAAPITFRLSAGLGIHIHKIHKSGGPIELDCNPLSLLSSVTWSLVRSESVVVRAGSWAVTCCSWGLRWTGLPRVLQRAAVIEGGGDAGGPGTLTPGNLTRTLVHRWPQMATDDGSTKGLR